MDKFSMFERPNIVSPQLFACLASGDVEQFCSIRSKNGADEDLIPFLPCLLRSTLLPTIFDGNFSTIDQLRARILACDKANLLVSCLRCDFGQLETEIRKEVKIRRKNFTAYVKNEQSTSSFENANVDGKMKILLVEILSANFSTETAKTPQQTSSNTFRKFEPLDNPSTFDECCHLLCVAAAEMRGYLDLEVLAENLLRYKFGPLVVQRLLANFADSFSSIFTKLVQNGESVEDDSNFVSRKRVETLKLLCDMNPPFGATLATLCLSFRKLVCCFVESLLTNFEASNYVSVLCSLILGPDVQQRLWFNQFVHHAQKGRPGSATSSALAKLKGAIGGEMRRLTAQVEQAQDVDNLQHGANLLRLVCALRQSVGMKFNEEECNVIFEFLCRIPDVSPTSSRFITAALCYLICFPPNMTPNCDQELMVVAWLRRLVEMEAEFLKFGESYGETLFLMAINFHSSTQYQWLSQLVANVMRVKVLLKNNNLARLRAVFTQDLFSEQIVAEMASKIAVTKQLNVECQQSYLPIHCVQHLLTSRTFAKHKICIKDWIVAQLKECTLPLHPAVGSLLEAYCNSMLTLKSSMVHHSSATTSPLEENDISVYFVGDLFDSKLLTFRILLTYYVLLYDELINANLRILAAAGRFVQWPERLLEKIPIFYYFSYLELNSTNFQPIFCSMTRLVINRFPEYFLSNPIPAPLRLKSTKIKGFLAKLALKPEDLSTGLRNFRSFPAKTLSVLKRASKAIDAQVTSTLPDLVEALCLSFPTLLESDTPGQILDASAALWLQCERILPRLCHVSAVRALLPSDKLKHDDLCDDPLIVLRVDFRIFRCAQLLSILLRILRCYLSASRSRLGMQVQLAASMPVAGAGRKTSMQQQMTPSIPNGETEQREELMRALISVQDSTAVQILLEICLQKEEERTIESQELESSLKDIRGVVCSHLHQMFIADPILTKLIHFQGYSLELIPTVVELVPSMHICLDFVLEMLTQPAHTKRIFAVNLLSHLCEKYSIPKAFSCSKMTVNVLSTLVSALPSGEIAPLFEHLVEALLRISRHFPPLSSDIVSLLIQVGRICKSRLACNGIALEFGFADWTKTTNDFDEKYAESRVLKKLRTAFCENVADSVLNM